MSRIGKKPIPIPSGVSVEINGDRFAVKSSKGELERAVHPDISAVVEDGKVMVAIKRHSKKSRALWGLTRSLLANMIEGVSKGFEKKLEFEGVGFRATLDGGALAMQFGFSHPVKVNPPAGIQFKAEKNTITVSGCDKELVGNTAAGIRRIRPVEPYKGKGIRYQGEVVRRKAGKKATASA